MIDATLLCSTSPNATSSTKSNSFSSLSRDFSLERYLRPPFSQPEKSVPPPRKRRRLNDPTMSRSSLKFTSWRSSSRAYSPKSSFCGFAWILSGSIESGDTFGSNSTSS